MKIRYCVFVVQRRLFKKKKKVEVGPNTKVAEKVDSCSKKNILIV